MPRYAEDGSKCLTGNHPPFHLVAEEDEFPRVLQCPQRAKDSQVHIDHICTMLKATDNDSSVSQ